MELDAERLRSLFSYDPLTGCWVATYVRRGRKPNYEKRVSRRTLKIDGEYYLTSRLAFLYMLGRWPIGDVDHKDLNPKNEIWANLRECSHIQNLANCTKRSHNKSGFKGVYWHKQGKKWTSQVTRSGKTFSLGLYDCPVAAHLAYVVAADKLFGEFART